MALVNSKREFPTELKEPSGIIAYFTDYFEGKGYAVKTESTATGAFISMTKGGVFKTISGMKTGLNITLTQKDGAIEAAMEVGIFGKQLLPSAISMLIAWPVLIPQVIGLIQQNKLDQEAYQVIENAIRHCEHHSVDRSVTKFCPFCGKAVPDGSMFCPGCGKNISDEIICPRCGASVPKGSAFCPKCGAKQE